MYSQDWAQISLCKSSQWSGNTALLVPWLLVLLGLVNQNKLNFSSINCNNRTILWGMIGLIDWQLRHQRDHIIDNFGMEILVPDSDF